MPSAAVLDEGQVPKPPEEHLADALREAFQNLDISGITPEDIISRFTKSGGIDRVRITVERKMKEYNDAQKRHTLAASEEWLNAVPRSGDGLNPQKLIQEAQDAVLATVKDRIGRDVDSVTEQGRAAWFFECVREELINACKEDEAAAKAEEDLPPPPKVENGAQAILKNLSRNVTRARQVDLANDSAKMSSRKEQFANGHVDTATNEKSNQDVKNQSMMNGNRTPRETTGALAKEEKVSERATEKDQKESTLAPKSSKGKDGERDPQEGVVERATENDQKENTLAPRPSKGKGAERRVQKSKQKERPSASQALPSSNAEKPTDASEAATRATEATPPIQCEDRDMDYDALADDLLLGGDGDSSNEKDIEEKTESKPIEKPVPNSKDQHTSDKKTEEQSGHTSAPERASIAEPSEGSIMRFPPRESSDEESKKGYPEQPKDSRENKKTVHKVLTSQSQELSAMEIEEKYTQEDSQRAVEVTMPTQENSTNEEQEEDNKKTETPDKENPSAPETSHVQPTVCKSVKEDTGKVNVEEETKLGSEKTLSVAKASHMRNKAGELLKVDVDDAKSDEKAEGDREENHSPAQVSHADNQVGAPTVAHGEMAKSREEIEGDLEKNRGAEQILLALSRGTIPVKTSGEKTSLEEKIEDHRERHHGTEQASCAQNKTAELAKPDGKNVNPDVENTEGDGAQSHDATQGSHPQNKATGPVKVDTKKESPKQKATAGAEESQTTEEASHVQDKAGEPDKQTEPHKTAEPVKEAEPVKATAPVKTAEPIQAADPVEAADPVKTAALLKTAEPVNAAEPPTADLRMAKSKKQTKDVGEGKNTAEVSHMQKRTSELVKEDADKTKLKEQADLEESDSAPQASYVQDEPDKPVKAHSERASSEKPVKRIGVSNESKEEGDRVVQQKQKKSEDVPEQTLEEQPSIVPGVKITTVKREEKNDSHPSKNRAQGTGEHQNKEGKKIISLPGQSDERETRTSDKSEEDQHQKSRADEIPSRGGNQESMSQMDKRSGQSESDHRRGSQRDATQHATRVAKSPARRISRRRSSRTTPTDEHDATNLGETAKDTDAQKATAANKGKKRGRPKRKVEEKADQEPETKRKNMKGDGSKTRKEVSEKKRKRSRATEDRESLPTQRTEDRPDPEVENWPRGYGITKSCAPEDFDAQQKVLHAIKMLLEKEYVSPFSEPVDTSESGLEMYASIIKNPMDLGEICKRLENSSSKSGYYLNVSEVLQDINLVWWNCKRYNGQFDPIIGLCEQAQNEMSFLLQQHGIEVEKVVQKRRRVSRGAVLSIQTPEEDAALGDNDGRLVGKTILIFTELKKRRKKEWFSVEVKAYDSKSKSYTLLWVDEGKTTKKATFGPDKMYPVYRA